MLLVEKSIASEYRRVVAETHMESRTSHPNKTKLILPWGTSLMLSVIGACVATCIL